MPGDPNAPDDSLSRRSEDIEHTEILNRLDVDEVGDDDDGGSDVFEEGDDGSDVKKKKKKKKKVGLEDGNSAFLRRFAAYLHPGRPLPSLPHSPCCLSILLPHPKYITKRRERKSWVLYQNLGTNPPDPEWTPQCEKRQNVDSMKPWHP